MEGEGEEELIKNGKGEGATLEGEQQQMEEENSGETNGSD